MARPRHPFVASQRGGLTRGLEETTDVRAGHDDRGHCQPCAVRLLRSDCEQAAENTDRELWREVDDDYDTPSLFVTESGSIGMNVGGTVVVMPIREWHATISARDAEIAALQDALEQVLTCLDGAEAALDGAKA